MVVAVVTVAVSVFCRSGFLKRKGVCVSLLGQVGKILVGHISQIILVVGPLCLFSGMSQWPNKRMVFGVCFRKVI